VTASLNVLGRLVRESLIGLTSSLALVVLHGFPPPQQLDRTAYLTRIDSKASVSSELSDSLTSTSLVGISSDSTKHEACPVKHALIQDCTINEFRSDNGSVFTSCLCSNNVEAMVEFVYN
jgi:hypothetical protein